MVSAYYRKMHSEFLQYSQDDRDKAIWQFLRERQTCSRCGTRPDEWDEDKGGHRWAYRGDIVRCDGCVVLQRTEDSPLLKDPSTSRGLSATLVRNPLDE